jgi:ketosteroid isomerase-like protein
VADSNCDLIERVEREWRDALCAKDMTKLRSLVHPKFTLIGTRAAGSFTLNRDEWLDAIQKREVVNVELAVRDAVVLADVMLGTVEARWRVRMVGREVEDCVLLTDVWVCENDRWQVVRRHSSPLPPGECSARAATGR